MFWLNKSLMDEHVCSCHAYFSTYLLVLEPYSNRVKLRIDTEAGKVSLHVNLLVKTHLAITLKNWEGPGDEASYRQLFYYTAPVHLLIETTSHDTTKLAWVHGVSSLISILGLEWLIIYDVSSDLKCWLD